MKLGSILGALSPGLSATGLFGDNAQKGGLAALGAMSPLLGLILAMKKKKKQGDVAADPNAPVVNQPAVQSAIARAMNPGVPPMPPGVVQPPFGMARPPGMY